MYTHTKPITKIANVLSELGEVSIVPPGRKVIFLVCILLFLSNLVLRFIIILLFQLVFMQLIFQLCIILLKS